MRLRSVLPWAPSLLVVLLVGVAVLLCTLDAAPGTLLLWELDGSQLGLILLFLALPVATYALCQLWVVAGPVPWGWVRVLTRMTAVVATLALLPIGGAIVFVSGFALGVEYVRLSVPGRDLVAYSNAWAESVGILERDGLYYRETDCRLSYLMHDVLTHNAYEATIEGGHTIVRYDVVPGGPRWGELDLHEECFREPG